jgi:hypothetical protein
VYVARRGWHTDVGFALADPEPRLRALASGLPSAHYLFFGFGDMRYLLAKHHGSSTLAAALWPGRGIMLVTGLANTPQQSFGLPHVIEFDLDIVEAQALQAWIWESFVSEAGSASLYRPGPYEGSWYFLARARYSALHTCNTWAAEALKAGGLPVLSRGVLFAGQLWSQLTRLQPAQRPAPSVAPASRHEGSDVTGRAASCHPDTPPSSPNSPARLPWSSPAAAGSSC